MESVTILNAIGQINDEMIESAVIQVPLKKNILFRMTALRRAVAIAACLALVIGLLFAISELRSYGSLGGPDGPVIGIIGTQGSEPTQGDKPTQGTEPTQDTELIQGTEPSQGDDNSDYVIVDSVMMDAMSSYAMSCTIPVEYGTEAGYIPITVSFGLIEGCEPETVYYPEIRFEAGDHEGQTIVFDRINTEDIMKPEYAVECVWDEDWMWIIGFEFTHTETINLPLTLFSEDSGRIWISITEYSSNGDMGSGAYVVLYYTRSDNSITFSTMVSSCMI